MEYVHLRSRSLHSTPIQSSLPKILIFPAPIKSPLTKVPLVLRSLIWATVFPRILILDITKCILLTTLSILSLGSKSIFFNDKSQHSGTWPNLKKSFFSPKNTKNRLGNIQSILKIADSDRS